MNFIPNFGEIQLLSGSTKKNATPTQKSKKLLEKVKKVKDRRVFER